MRKEFNLKGYIFGALRKIWRWYPPRREALARQKQGVGYKCEGCNYIFRKEEVQVDHIKPAIDPKAGFLSYDDYIARLFCGLDNLQVLCKATCHKEKTNKENKIRKEIKKNVNTNENTGNGEGSSSNNKREPKKSRRARKKI